MSVLRSADVERIAHRELRNNSAEILRRVADGESFEVTNHGEVVAILGPPDADRRWELEIVKPATRSLSWHEITRQKASRPTAEILDGLRDERG